MFLTTPSMIWPSLEWVLDQARTLFSAGFFQHRTARNDDVATAAIHFQDLERLRNVHQRLHVAHRADIDLRTGQERHGAVEIDGEATLDAAEDHAFDALAFTEFGFQLVPGGFAAGAVAAEHRFAVGVFRRGRHRLRLHRRPTGRAACRERQIRAKARGLRFSGRRRSRPCHFQWRVTVPFTTRPSNPPFAADPSVSSSIAAKSSRVGLDDISLFKSCWSSISGLAVVSAGLSSRAGSGMDGEKFARGVKRAVPPAGPSAVAGIP